MHAKIILMMLPFNLGMPEVVAIMGVALLVFGPKKLPELGRNMGKGMRNFKDSLGEATEELKAGFNEDTTKSDENSLKNDDLTVKNQ